MQLGSWGVQSLGAVEHRLRRRRRCRHAYMSRSCACVALVVTMAQRQVLLVSIPLRLNAPPNFYDPGTVRGAVPIQGCLLQPPNPSTHPATAAASAHRSSRRPMPLPCSPAPDATGRAAGARGVVPAEQLAQTHCTVLPGPWAHVGALHLRLSCVRCRWRRCGSRAGALTVTRAVGSEEALTSHKLQLLRHKRPAGGAGSSRAVWAAVPLHGRRRAGHLHAAPRAVQRVDAHQCFASLRVGRPENSWRRGGHGRAPGGTRPSTA